MAVPDSLAAWREFAARQVVEPRPMTAEQLVRLSTADKNTYDEDRFAWLGSDVVLETHDTEALTRQTRIIMRRNTGCTATARRGIAMSGSPGLGKSTAALLIARLHERAMRRKAGREIDINYAPSAYIVVPPGTTPKMMMLAFANFLGLTASSKATAQDLAEQVVGVMRYLGTSLVIVDEVHNLRTNQQAGSDAASALKAFSERLDATFIYAGIDLLQSDLFSGDMGRQMKGRMIVHQMRPYGHSTQEQRDAWLDLVLGIEALLPLSRHNEGSLASAAPYLYDRTGGSIGSLRALLSDAAIAAIDDGSEMVNRALLDTVATDRASEEFRVGTPVREPKTPSPLRRAE
ncbi:ATP-binding protein [Mycobacteroides chelonae]|uniref:ATP-binding protein n=1 Tax=Mycobacteroides chelonae TaxID=1774 RepID=UPI000992C327|nr:ATP-binding protein [Mycobacteroides chelonae]